MDKIKQALLLAAKGSAHADFSASDVQDAASNILAEMFEGRNLRHLNASDFQIIEEILDEVTPIQVEDIIGRFAEVRTFGYNDQVLFAVKNVGGTRVMQAVVPGARAGIYRARRLDNRHLEVTTHTETVAYKLSFEDLVTGRVTLGDFVALVTRGFVEIVYQRMITALRTAAALAPEANRYETHGATIELKALDRVLRTIGAYGRPTIFTFQSLAAELGNVATDNMMTYAPSRATQDLADIRNLGYVTTYKGTDVVVLPNFLVDNTNERWVFNEDQMFILPADEKPIKVAFHGGLYVQPGEFNHGGQEWNAHRTMGVAVLSNNAIGSFTVSDWEFTGVM